MATIATSPFNPPKSKLDTKDIGAIDSSFLENFKHDPETKQLSVTMKNGAQYLYFGVDSFVMEELAKAPSKGRFFAEQIKGKYNGQSLVPKTIGPQSRNPLKGPKPNESRKQPVHYRPA